MKIKDLRDKILHESTKSKYFTDRYYIEIKRYKDLTDIIENLILMNRIFLFKKK